MEYEWTNSLSVGVDLIDEQHKMLIAKLNDLSVAVDRGQGSQKIIRTLDFLIEYTNFHFGTEEKYMNELAYPQRDFHVGQHMEFITTLNNLEEDFLEEGATASLAEAINTFMFNWLVKHIKSVDVQFGKFLDEKGVEMVGEV